jgi:hypothetical protein
VLSLGFTSGPVAAWIDSSIRVKPVRPLSRTAPTSSRRTL